MNHDEFKILTWDEAEKLFPECSAAWDRDVGDKITPEMLVSEYIAGNPRLVAAIGVCVGRFRTYNNKINQTINTDDCHCYRYDNKQWQRLSDKRNV